MPANCPQRPRRRWPGYGKAENAVTRCRGCGSGGFMRENKQGGKMINERIKLLANLKEAAAKYRCGIPDDAALSILNDPANKIALNYPDDYKKIPWSDVDSLIVERKKLF
jgi:hypothetical protein